MRNIESPYLPLQTIPQAQEIGRIQAGITNRMPHFPHGCCLETAQAIKAVFGWPIVAGPSNIKKKAFRKSSMHYGNIAPPQNSRRRKHYVDGSFHQHDPRRALPSYDGIECPDSLQAFIEHGIPPIVVLPFPTPILEIDRTATKEANSEPLDEDVRTILNELYPNRFQAPSW